MSSELVKGTIILLNGTSSSGKSSIANSLQKILDEPYLHIGLDKFRLYYNDSFPKQFNPLPFPKNITDDEWYAFRDKSDFWNKRFSAFHRHIAALSLAGINAIVDTVFGTKYVLQQCVEILYEYPILLVGVQCPLEELEKREKERKNRKQGLAKRQYNRVHAHAVYDLEVDTSKYTSMECAQRIQEIIQSNPKGFSSKAIRKLKEKLIF